MTQHRHTMDRATRQVDAALATIDVAHGFKVTLSWPASELMQNRHDGHHWSYAAAEKADYRREGYLMALSAINTRRYDPKPERLYRVSMVFHPPDKRRRDVSNLHAAMKSALDGISDAMGVNDVRFVEHTQRMGIAIENGSVVITVEEM